MSEEYQIPRFFRVLIIDDMVAASQEYKVFFTNILTALVLEAAGGAMAMSQVDVVFEYDPAKGFKRWQNEPFDLTLIDADFSTNRGTADDTNDLAQYVLNSRDQGLQIFKLLEAQMNESGLFAYRKEMCRFFVWTALPDEDKDDKLSELHILLKRFGITKKAVIKKNKESLGVLKDKIDACVKNILNNKFFTPSQKIERLLFAMRKDNDVLLRDLYGGCLIFDAEKKYTFLPTLRKHKKYDAEIDIRLCYAHIPDSLLLAKQQAKTRFLPLHGSIYEGSLADAVHYILSEKSSEISKYCDNLKSRAYNVSLNIPLFPFPSKQGNGSGKKIFGYSLKNEFIAAATPLTGTSVIGEENAIPALAAKVKALVDGPFGAVILKTTYLDEQEQWKNVYWPGLQIQSHMRTRCLFPNTGTPTLWNTGRTAMETLPPRSLNILLRILGQVECLNGKTHRVIVSLGSKFHKEGELARGYRDNLKASMKEIWDILFCEVFQDINPECFPMVEINVRHFLREIVQYYLGGDEYLNPSKLDEKNLSDSASFWEEFKTWLAVLHDVAVQHKKILILKLPHRSDTLAYVKCATSLRELHLATFKEKAEKDFGVRGITLVNALKTPVPLTNSDENSLQFTPSWYANPKSWKDADNKLFKYQMSGRFVGPYRNQILAGIIPVLQKLRTIEMEVFLSGGITSRTDLQFCQNIEQYHLYGYKDKKETERVITGIQIGTWALLETNLAQTNWARMTDPAGPAQPIYVKYKVDVSECRAGCCTNIDKFCPLGALLKKGKKKTELVDEKLCWECTSWNCIAECHRKGKGQGLKKLIVPPDNICPSLPSRKSEKEKAIFPRISYLNERKCQACGRCQRTFYCDSFLDRANTKLSPMMDSRNCSGCGLCVQVCSSGALQLYEPGEMLVLLSASEERREILRRLNIPFLAYHPVDDISNFGILQSMEDFNGIANSLRDDKTMEGEELCKFVNILWSQRLGQGEEKKDEYLLGKGREKTYPDKREDRQDVCIETAGELIEKYNNTSEAAHKTALIRAYCSNNPLDFVN